MTHRNSYRLHKPSGQAVVTLGGHTFYLGEHGTPESRAEYERLVAEGKAQGGQLFKPGPDGLSVNEVMLAWVREYADYYRKPDGRSTGEFELVKLALRPLKRLYGHRAAKNFGPLALKACRHDMIETGLSRKTINNHVARIKRVFRWATENELVPPSLYEGLRAVAGLRRGRSQAKETEPVRPVPEAHIEAVLPHLPGPVAAMVELQNVTGMRSGEMVTMRVGELTRGPDVWEYTPASHKTEHHGFERVIPLGPKAQSLIRPFLKADAQAFVFSPREAEATRRKERRDNRASPMTPSQAKRKRGRKPKRAPGESYTVHSYRRCIARACENADVPHWHPHQLRHNAATRIRKEHGIEAARAVLGQRSVAVTEIYAEQDRTLAARVMSQVG
ncbi:MAG: site-specific integrase [Planctomycetota bacterium]